VNKSNIKWTGKELTTKEHYGALKFSKANLEYKNEKLVGGEFVVDMTTLDVQDLSGRGKERLEGHLRSDDFFSVDKHNNAYLKITEVIPAEFSRITLNEKYYELVGDLTIKDITHPITFTLKPEDNQSFKAELIFDRSKYNVRFRSGSFFENLGDKLILDDIKLEVTLVKN
jgi:polyisoprenoid-binding protein YceI